MLCYTFHTIPKKGSTGIPRIVQVPHSIHAESEICLIVRKGLKEKTER